MTEICFIIHKCTIYSEKNYMNLDFPAQLSFKTKSKIPHNGEIKLIL